MGYIADTYKIGERVTVEVWPSDHFDEDCDGIVIDISHTGLTISEAGGIYEELRGVAGELQIPIWTASQSNRAAMDDDIIQANNISDSYRKIMTADFVLSLSRKVAEDRQS